MSDEHGLDPDEVAQIEARLELIAQQHDFEALAEVVANLCRTVMGVADAMKALGEVVWPATRAIEHLAEQIKDLQDD